MSAEDLLRGAETAREAGDLDRAQSACETVLRREPANARALTLLAALAADRGDALQGLKWAEQACAAAPADAAPHYVRGRLYELQDRLPEAEESYRRAVALAPRDARAHNNLGGVLHMQGRLSEALACYRAALDIDPAQPQANHNYASIARDPSAMEAAVEGYRRRTAEHPRDADAFKDLGNVYREMGRLDEALASYDRALSLAPGFAEARLSRAFVLLRKGEYARGWEDYEWRLRMPAQGGGRFPQPMWDGRAMPQGTLLLHAEQGLGDTLQFARYGELAAARCGRVVLECQKELKDLLSPLPGYSRVLAQGEPLPPFDAHLPLMSLGRVMQTSLDSVPWSGPYVHAPAQRAALWRAELPPAAGKLRIGLVWAGAPGHWDDRNRSIRLEMLAPLATVAGASFFSLQKGAPAEQAGSPPAGMELVDLSARIRDFSDTAAIISALDVVVSVDTSVAHLAGAMGAKIWVLVPFCADWRYPAGRRDNPWYPTMRVFGQPSDGDWAGAIGALRQALAQLRRPD